MKRKLTRKVLRRRRIIRRLTALAMLLCVIAAGIYLTVTMLFKISAIQVRTADGVVSEAGGLFQRADRSGAGRQPRREHLQL